MEITDGPTELRGREYWTNWRLYTDGQWRLARQGEDYAEPAKFTTNGRIWASRNGYRWSQAMTDGGVKFRIWRPVPDPFPLGVPDEQA
jgi:hypothetical protein